MNLQRPGDTRWSSHLKSISSLIKMFRTTCNVLGKIVDEGNTPSQRGEAFSSLEAMNSFEFVFVLHLMKEIMEITDSLCQALQRKSQDILNAMHLVSSTKDLLQNLRDNGWETLLAKVKSFCEVQSVDVPDMSTCYVERRGRARRQRDNVSVEHHYRVDIFNAAIDFQLQELNNRFSEKAVELLMLSCALDPREWCKGFQVDNLCKLVHKFYPQDFTDFEKEELRVQLLHFEAEITKNGDAQKLSGISELCRWLVETRKLDIYPLIHRLIKLILTLPVSTATTERAFSAMTIVKTRLRNKMDDDFLENCLIIYIEREIAKKFSVDSIINGFRDMKERRALL
ncbi:uncharacterized protein [Spinacia oleracea]|uniref:HAT C-terminal dimerisation domain-containing protein n=1 Tax=Spinacia oleracea TaxID=3562 RepID=A0A9R0IAB6_SPIOL|nr:uncharacterized protein LOC110785261 [Spinacia oleracea]